MHVCRLYQCVITWVELNLGGEREGNRPISDVDKYWFSFKDFQRYSGRSFCLYVGSPVAHVRALFLLLSFSRTLNLISGFLNVVHQQTIRALQCACTLPPLGLHCHTRNSVSFQNFAVAAQLWVGCFCFSDALSVTQHNNIYPGPECVVCSSSKSESGQTKCTCVCVYDNIHP